MAASTSRAVDASALALEARRPRCAEIEAAANDALDAISEAGRPYDVVASTCVLTQMAFALRESLASGTRRSKRRASRSCAAPVDARGADGAGGVALFASDVVSSTTYPLAEPAPGAPSGRLARRRLVGRGLLRRQPELVPAPRRGGRARAAGAVAVDRPLERTYLVYALRLRVP